MTFCSVRLPSSSLSYLRRSPRPTSNTTSDLRMGNQIRERAVSSSPSPHEREEPSPKRARLEADNTSPEKKLAHALLHPGHKLYTPGAYLAPMVRIGTLPTRLLALEYGADLVWGPEIVDKAIIGSARVVDERSGTIQYTKNNGSSSIWQTHPIE